MTDTLTAPSARRQVAPRHLTGPQDLGHPLIVQLLERAAGFENGGGDPDRLRRRLLATIFYEPSTRTRLSFEAAMLRLGGQVLSAESAGTTSSAVKGESLEDAIRVISAYADVIVLRHPEVGAAQRAARVADVPVINAGDGPGDHPTQALLDLYTIKKELGRLDHLRIGLAGDLRNGRTVRSLAALLSRFPGNELVLISPPALRMGSDVIEALTEAQQAMQETGDLGGAIADLDVLYQTRIQAERFESSEEYERHRGVYVVTADLMRRLPERAILMHPLPRLEELEGVRLSVIPLDVRAYRDDLPRAAAAPLPILPAVAVDGRPVLLVDDVLFNGRTTRAAIDAVIAAGRPTQIQLAVLVDRGHRELPIRPDYIGKNVPTSRQEWVDVHLTETDGEDSVRIIERGDS